MAACPLKWCFNDVEGGKMTSLGLRMFFRMFGVTLNLNQCKSTEIYWFSVKIVSLVPHFSRLGNVSWSSKRWKIQPLKGMRAAALDRCSTLWEVFREMAWHLECYNRRWNMPAFVGKKCWCYGWSRFWLAFSAVRIKESVATGGGGGRLEQAKSRWGRATPREPLISARQRVPKDEVLSSDT